MKRINFILGSTLLAFLPLFAMAQSFTPPETDVSLRYLTSIFGMVPGALSGAGSQIMGTMFSVFNSAVLSLGGIIVTYILIVSTMNTAHDGEVMGKKWSSIWIPLRSALGVGLLLPKATGYCFIQVFVMWVVVQGIGAADSIWNAALNYLNKGGVIIYSSFQPSIRGQAAAQASLDNLFKSMVCVYALQATLEKRYVDNISSATQVDAVPLLTATVDPVTVVGNTLGSKKLKFPNIDAAQYPAYASLTGACGSVTWDTGGTNTAYASTSVAATAGVRTMALQQMINSVAGAAQQVVQNAQLPASVQLKIGKCPPSGACKQIPWLEYNGNSVLPGSVLQNAYSNYTAIMLPATRSGASLSGFGEVNSMADAARGTFATIGNGIGSGLNDLGTGFQGTKWVPGASRDGWILAGSYYYKLARVNDDIRMKTDSAIPEVQGPSAANLACVEAAGGELYGTLGSAYCSTFKAYYQQKQVSQYAHDAVYDYRIANSDDVAHRARFAGGINVASKIAFILSPFLYPFMGLLVDFVRLAAAEQTNENPVVVMASLGSNMIGVCSIIWILAGTITIATFALGLVPCNTLSNGLLALSTWLAPFISGLLVMMFMAGATLAYYIPMIPFIVFSFAAIGWFIGVIESMVAAPIVALGLIHPEGHEHFGKSDQAIMLLTNVFLRPSMMIVGLIAGIALSYVGVWLINRGFGEALKMVAASINGWALLYSPLAFAIIYASLGVSVIHKAFSLIHIIPDKVLRWLSGGQQESLGAEGVQEALGSARGGISQGFNTAGGDFSRKANENLKEGGGGKQHTADVKAKLKGEGGIKPDGGSGAKGG